MAVDQARRDGRAVGIDNGGGAFGVDVLQSADGGNLAVLGNDGVGIQNRLFQRSRQHQPDVADHELAGAGRLWCVMGHGTFPPEIAGKFEPGLTFGSSRIICLYTNDRIRMNWPVNGPAKPEQDTSAMSNFNQESVTSVHHWTDNLFSFTTTRDPSFRFRNGEFTMIGLKGGEKPLLRAYSVARPNYEDELEFFSIKVQDGPLTSRLQHLKVGDPIIVSRKATGTLVIDNLESGRNLYLIGTGTGLAPFLSVIKDPETYERFE